MSNVDDLLDPLRYTALGDFDLTKLREIGGGVFTEAGTLDHLKMLDLIIKAYASVHAPTYGHAIPSTPYGYTDTIDSATTTKIIETAPGEVIAIQNINLFSSETGTGAIVAIATDEGQIYLSTSDLVQNEPTIMMPKTITYPLSLVYPQVLQIITSSSGAIDLSYMVMTYRTQQ